jgi:hypothetical protein
MYRSGRGGASPSASIAGSAPSLAWDAGRLETPAHSGAAVAPRGSSGQPLDASTLSFMEGRFGHDFGAVRVHADAAAARSADAMGASAYAVGSEIYFGSGRYEPTTPQGRSLVAHELVHVVQQRQSQGAATQTLTPYSHPAEAEARSLSHSVLDGRTAGPVTTTATPHAVSAQLDPRKVYCALHAAVCLGLTENPPAAALCWANFAARCGGAMAQAGQPGAGGEGGEAVAGASPAGAVPTGEGAEAPA